jgi:hypothetical protein
MPVKINADGTWSQDYVGPYTGYHTLAPETLIPDNASPAFNNFMLRNAELRSRPALTALTGGNSGGIGTPVGQTVFLDANGTYHLVSWSDTLSGFSLLQWNPSGPGWVNVGPAAYAPLQGNPLAYRTFANTVYYTGIGFLAGQPHRLSGGGGGRPAQTFPVVGLWDGITATPTWTQTFSDSSVSRSIAGISLTDSPTVGGSLPGAPTIVGPIAIGAGFISELNNTLLLANVTIADQGNSNKIYTFPNLIWWSANGLPLQWDPTQNTSAGFNPFLDVPDQITGLAMLGIAGYIFRAAGITQMTPTGSSSTPWEFDHMWASDRGIGNAYPWSIAQYGPTAAFIAQDNIYALSITNASPIGGTARDAIMTDLSNASGTAFANIIPIFNLGYVYLTYQLFIPMSTFVRQWVYSFEEKNWAPWNLNAFGSVSAAPSLV